MADKTGIEWTDATWNPVVGCTHVSAGCDNCYAARETSGRLKNNPTYAGLAVDGKFTGEVRLLPERLDQPLRWQKPRLVFVNSMSDLFHDAVPISFIGQVFAIMARSSRHRFQILTKRPGRMRSVLSNPVLPAMVWNRMLMADNTLPEPTWPLSNVWLGTSVENQHWAGVRVPQLLGTPAAVRWLSCEPLLGPVDLDPWLFTPNVPRLDWIVVGGESGPNARPMHPDWARQIRDTCEETGVPFLFKQWGEWAPGRRNSQLSAHRWQYESVRFRPTGERYTPADVGNDETGWSAPGMTSLLRVGKKAAGRELDGRFHDGYPGSAVAR